MIYVFLNKLSNNGKAAEAQTEVEKIFEGQELKFVDVTQIKDAAESCQSLAPEDKIVVAGGDGTMSRFANDVYQFLESLPVVTVNGESHYFINGIGYGIDGYCCEEADKQRAVSNKPVNYSGIAIKGVLGKFKPRRATVTVDGQSVTYKKVWLAPTMIGRYFGGGMKITPEQDRLNKEHVVSCGVIHDSGRLKTLIVFPKFFTGEHVSHKEMVEIKTGHEVKVEFDVPCALQIDGETYLNVKYYTVSYN